MIECTKPICKSQGCMFPQDCPEERPSPPVSGSACAITSDIKRAIIRLKVAIESAERHLPLGIRPPLTVCFCLWSDLRKIEELLKKHDPKPPPMGKTEMDAIDRNDRMF
jgi:hypothetical protein